MDVPSEKGDAVSGAAKEGTGLRYIKARLEESFTGRWKYAGIPIPGGWETMIEIHGAPRDSHELPTGVAFAKQHPA